MTYGNFVRLFMSAREVFCESYTHQTSSLLGSHSCGELRPRRPFSKEYKQEICIFWSHLSQKLMQGDLPANVKEDLFSDGEDPKDPRNYALLVDAYNDTCQGIVAYTSSARYGVIAYHYACKKLLLLNWQEGCEYWVIFCSDTRIGVRALNGQTICLSWMSSLSVLQVFLLCRRLWRPSLLERQALPSSSITILLLAADRLPHTAS